MEVAIDHKGNSSLPVVTGVTVPPTNPTLGETNVLWSRPAVGHQPPSIWQSMKKQMVELRRQVTKDTMPIKCGIPLSEHIMEEELFPHFRAPSDLPAYGGATNPVISWPKGLEEGPQLLKSKYFYMYHREYRHNNNHCRHLRQEIERLTQLHRVEQQDEDPHKRENIRKEALGGEMSPEDVPAKGSSTNVLFYKVYQQMELGDIPLEPVDTLLLAIKTQALAEFIDEVSNNEVTYEAFITGIKMALDARANSVIAYSDSQLVKTQVGDYLIQGILLADEMEAARLKSRAARFALFEDILYKCSFSQPYLRCLSIEEGYLWPTLKKDVINGAKRCEQCQKHAPLIHIPAELFKPISAPCSFSQWGIDIVGPFLTAQGHCNFLLMVVDYFIVNFRVGRFKVCVPSGTSYKHFTSVVYPQANGLIEVTNCILVQGSKESLNKQGILVLLNGVSMSQRDTHKLKKVQPIELYICLAVVKPTPEEWSKICQVKDLETGHRGSYRDLH
ncbi:hypothetical protein Sango_2692300 [Sesamum angolense]|uniref:RNase H type-1 domain-containing protein n=1 Tax=Sesamum angolense TaxID=2727404 RepID=A0AAE2BHK6_9LAMI|nr:hypothetical protein Sango_2692300 [Sesamum angolense]